MIHYDHDLHANVTKLIGGAGLEKDYIESLPSITATFAQIEAVYLKHHPDYVDDGDIDWVEHYWFLSHFKAVAYRLSHYAEKPIYRFYFGTEEEAVMARMHL